MHSNQQVQPQPQPPTAIGGSETQAHEGQLQGNVDLMATGYTGPQMTSAVPVGTENAPYYQGPQAPFTAFQNQLKPVSCGFGCGCGCCCTVVGVFGMLFAIGFIFAEIELIALDKELDDYDRRRQVDSDSNYLPLRVCLMIGKILNLLANVGLIAGVSMKLLVPCLVWIIVTAIETVFHTLGSLSLNYNNKKYEVIPLNPFILGAYICHLLLQLVFLLAVVLLVKDLTRQLALKTGQEEGQSEIPPAVQTSMTSQQYGPYSGNGNAVAAPGTQIEYNGGNLGNFGPPPPYQTLAPQPLMQNSDGVDLNAGPGQPYPASLATHS